MSAWTLLDLYHRLGAWGDAGAFADGRLAIPENANGRDDLLDEVRIDVECLLAMQVPEGRRLTVAAIRTRIETLADKVLAERSRIAYRLPTPAMTGVSTRRC